ncbi:MAG: hypothetical protein HC896_17925 [Bacteroidales bacterium]|nr:hypothetical protein [Bacteroidales bacterium]
MRISILGCGWLGLPLAEHFSGKGMQVKGSVRDIEKKTALLNAGIEAYVINIANKLQGENIDPFFDTDLLIINYPPPKADNAEKLHVQQLAEITGRLANPGAKVVFVSSTSVYPNTNGWVTEECNLLPEKGSGMVLLAAEKFLVNALGNKVTILRFGGLIGYTRNPARFLAGSKRQKKR